MADIYLQEKRSDVMSRIRSKNTKPEVVLRKALHRLGYRFRLHVKTLPGKPDIVYPSIIRLFKFVDAFGMDTTVSMGTCQRVTKDTGSLSYLKTNRGTEITIVHSEVKVGQS